MKKLLLVLLAALMCISLCACGKSIDGESMTYIGPGNIKYTASFNDGTFEIRWSSGDKKGSETHSYTMDGKNKVIIDGETYTYEIDGNTVKFDKSLVGVSRTWSLK